MIDANRKSVINLVTASFFLLLSLLLPFIFLQSPQLGAIILPMHFPIFINGLLNGKKYGFIIGFIAPLLRTLLFGIPILFPTAIAMAFELGAYGWLTGLFSEQSKKSNVMLYVSIIIAMIAGRIVWGALFIAFMTAGLAQITLSQFFQTMFVVSLPGIILQLLLIPPIVKVSQRFVMYEH